METIYSPLKCDILITWNQFNIFRNFLEHYLFNAVISHCIKNNPLKASDICIIYDDNKKKSKLTEIIIYTILEIYLSLVLTKNTHKF